ncbi:MAG: ABC transporter ATP-binding protein, partial [Thiovulaceae bacterium]|nr:ABC transporter ATP-binding protein [Sulfurimonadaceae bacterium]
KLTYKENEAIKSLPLEIEALEAKIDKINACLADAACYGEKGISAVAKELSECEALYEAKVEEMLAIEEKLEEIEAQKA